MARGTKNNQKLGVNPKNVQAYERLSYLHQAAILMSTIKYDTPQDDQSTTTSNSTRDNWQGDPKGTLLATSRYLNNNIRQITGKLVMRIDPSVKRTICRRCETPIIPAITSTTRIKSKPAATVVQKCKICKASRRYRYQNLQYNLFSERTDNIHVEDKPVQSDCQ